MTFFKRVTTLNKRLEYKVNKEDILYFETAGSLLSTPKQTKLLYTQVFLLHVIIYIINSNQTFLFGSRLEPFLKEFQNFEKQFYKAAAGHPGFHVIFS